MPTEQSANRMHFELRIASALHSTSQHFTTLWSASNYLNYLAIIVPH